MTRQASSFTVRLLLKKSLENLEVEESRTLCHPTGTMFTALLWDVSPLFAPSICDGSSHPGS